MEVRPYSAAIGAEISGLNLSEPLGREALLKLHRALLMYQVLFVLDQALTPEQQIRFSRQLGDLEPYPFSKGLKDYPEITEVVKLPDEYVNFGSGWHVDMSFNQSPPDGAALYAVEIPPAGGDTIFCNLTLAYNMLSEGHRAMLERVRGVHDSRTRYQMVNALKGMRMVDGDEFFRCVQPLTRIHPETADTSLFISPDYLFQLEEMTQKESSILLNALEEHAVRYEFTCRYRWSPNTLVIWDNRCIMHRAIEDDIRARVSGDGFRRVMHRTTFKRFYSHDELSQAR